MLTPLPERNSSTREAYLALRHAIISGLLAPDSRLYERRIGAELGVSRTPVREALAMLESEELVISVPNKGTVVRRITVEEITETYEVRIQLEGYAARLAPERITSRELGRLERIERDMQRVFRRQETDEDRLRELTSLNADFHLAIAEAARNRILVRTIKGLIETPIYARAYFWYTNPRRNESVSEHARMIELLRSGDKAACERFWREHHQRGRDYLVDYLSKREEDEGA
jgi:DNA-binding GntR family transcriptional regulator